MDKPIEQTEERGPSRSQLKREDNALLELSKELAKLSTLQIQQLPLSEQIIDALQDVVDMPPRSARKRQIKFIGSLMRKIDVTPVKEHLARLKNQSAHATRELHQLEQWRQRLLSDDKQALTDLLNQYPDADSQQLRQLIRNAIKEQMAEKPPKASRQLFRNLRGLLSQDSIKPTDS
jgi:ribosome-associated protein